VNLDELQTGLPNGLHDAILRTFSTDPNEGRAEFILDVWLGDLHSADPKERERYRPARLELVGLAYLVVEDPDPRSHANAESPVQIDACGPDDDEARASQLPPGGFAGRFFVTEWNAFIHFAALDARLTWIDVN